MGQFSFPRVEGSLEFSLAERVAARVYQARIDPSDWRSQLATGLTQPLGFPPLASTVVPGDHVTLSFEPRVTPAVEVVSILVNLLQRAGVDADHISLVFDPAWQAWEASLRTSLQQINADQAELVWHQAQNSVEHSYFAASEAGEPLYVARAIADADLFIPVGLTHPTQGVHASWYPLFSADATRERLSAARFSHAKSRSARKASEAEEAAWLLGVQFVVRLIPAAAGQLVDVICGSPQAVAPEAERKYRDCWEHALPDLVDAALLVFDQPAPQQTWSELAEALQRMSNVVREDGALIVWSDLSEPLGPALQSLVAGESLPSDATDHNWPDRATAEAFRELNESYRIYLRSNIDDETVENLGWGPLHSPVQLQRVLEEHSSCALIGSAQHAMVEVE